MKATIKKVENWLEAHQKTKEWIWFVGLWCFGLFFVMTVTYPIKWIIKHM